MRRILVPVDGSPGSDRAVRHVIDRVRNEGAAEVHLLYVDAANPARGAPALPEPVGPLQRDRQERMTQSGRRLLDEAGVPYECHFEMGEPSETIVRHARVHGCDEIVMGTRGCGTIRTLLPGSVATKVVHLVDRPVTLVP